MKRCEWRVRQVMVVGIIEVCGGGTWGWVRSLYRKQLPSRGVEGKPWTKITPLPASIAPASRQRPHTGDSQINRRVT